MGLDGGFESTSHFKDTAIPSLRGKPKPGSLLMANDGPSEKKKSKQLHNWLNRRHFLKGIHLKIDVASVGILCFILP